MVLARLIVGCTVFSLAGVTAVAGQRVGAGNASKPNETIIEDLDDLEPPYKAYTGLDYRPGQLPAPRTVIQDIVGIFVEDPLECAVRCNDDDLCNVAAYYGENPVGSWPKGFTCLLRVISVPCTLPTDLETTALPDTIFLIAQEEECEDEAAIVFNLGPSPGPNGTSSGNGTRSPGANETLAPMVDLLAPIEAGPMDAEPLSGPAEGPLPMIAPETAPPAVAPAGEPVATPPASTTPMSGVLIRNFDVTNAPDGPVNPSPDPPPAPPGDPVTDYDDLEPAGGPSQADEYEDFGVLTPGIPGIPGSEFSGAAHLQTVLAAASVCAALCMLP
eukprot:jgi/Ulvmu1/3042/UM015_0082.1